MNRAAQSMHERTEAMRHVEQIAVAAMGDDNVVELLVPRVVLCGKRDVHLSGIECRDHRFTALLMPLLRRTQLGQELVCGRCSQAGCCTFEHVPRSEEHTSELQSRENL